MEPEFLDPGPDQPPPGYAPAQLPSAYLPSTYLPPQAPLPGTAPPPRRTREAVGLLLALAGAGTLAAVAARLTLYSTVEQNVLGRSAFSVAASGDYRVSDGPQLAGHELRFGVLLTIAGVAFLLLALIAAGRLVAGRAQRPEQVAGALAGAATGLVGLLIGVTVGMTLQIQSAYSRYRSAQGVLELRMRIGSAVWLALAAVLVGAVSVMAALRVRRAFGGAPSGY